MLLLNTKVSPTSNQVRKWFHEVLIEITETRGKAEEVMSFLDTHAVKTLRKFYLMRDPKKQVKLGKLLVQTVIGDKAPPFPTKEEALAHMETNKDWSFFLFDVGPISNWSSVPAQTICLLGAVPSCVFLFCPN